MIVILLSSNLPKLVSSVATSLNRLVRNRAQLTGIPRSKYPIRPCSSLSDMIQSQFIKVNNELRPLLSAADSNIAGLSSSTLSLNISMIQSLALLETAVSAAISSGKYQGTA